MSHFILQGFAMKRTCMNTVDVKQQLAMLHRGKPMAKLTPLTVEETHIYVVYTQGWLAEDDDFSE